MNLPLPNVVAKVYYFTAIFIGIVVMLSQLKDPFKERLTWGDFYTGMTTGLLWPYFTIKFILDVISTVLRKFLG